MSDEGIAMAKDRAAGRSCEHCGSTAGFVRAIVERRLFHFAYDGTVIEDAGPPAVVSYDSMAVCMICHRPVAIPVPPV
jgi:hypothetical protein